MYNNNFINPRVFKPNNFTEETELSFEITNLTTKIDLDTQQYLYQNQLLQQAKVTPNKYEEIRARVNRLGLEIQNDKRRLVELGKRMAAITHNVNPKNYRPKF